MIFLKHIEKLAHLKCRIYIAITSCFCSGTETRTSTPAKIVLSIMVGAGGTNLAPRSSPLARAPPPRYLVPIISLGIRVDPEEMAGIAGQKHCMC